MPDPGDLSAFESRLQAALDGPDPDPAFVGRLRQRLLAKATGLRRQPRTARLRSAWAIVLAVLLVVAAAMAAVGPQRAWAAVRRLLGYIPGIGFVDNGSGLSVLREPVVQTRDGITLEVSQAIADASRTILIYRVTGLSIDAANSQGEGAANLGSLGLLVLPDGTELEQDGGDGSGWGTGYTMRLFFPALPAGMDAATFRLPRLNDMPPGAAPEGWEIPLRFVAAPPSLTVAPVFEVTPSAPAPDDHPEDAGPYGISLHIDRVIELEDGYILAGSTRWEESGRLPEGLMPTGLITIRDADGVEIPAQAENLEAGFETADDRRFAWAHRVQGLSFNGPLTLSLESVDAWFPVEASYLFDPGPDPHLGQTWSLELPLQVAGHTIRVESAQMITDHFGTGYEFAFLADADVTALGLTIAGAPPDSGGGGGSQGEFVASVLWSDQPPAGPLNVNIERIGLILHGPWQVEWQPPVSLGTPPATPAPPPQVCFNLESGRAARAYDTSPHLPAQTGRLLLYGPMEGYGGYVINIAPLDGSERVLVGVGTWPAFSPDGTRVAYSGVDGLYVRDLSAGTTERLPGTNENDYHPLWSPSGDRLAFVRGSGAFDLFVIRSENAELIEATTGPEYEELTGWTPDGQEIVYSMVGPDGIGVLRAVQIATGEARDLFRFEGRVKSVGASLSPDGESVVYRDVLFGNPSGGLYLSRLDGSDRRLIAALGMGGLSSPVWSPDGTWLAARIPDADSPVPVAVLIQPGSCDVAVLDGLKGEVFGWAP